MFLWIFENFFFLKFYIGIPGLTHLFKSQNEAVLQQNLRKSIFDFSKDWVNGDSICPISDSTSFSDAFYCHTMTFKECGLHLLSDAGGYEACEECPKWCSDSESPDAFYFN